MNSTLYFRYDLFQSLDAQANELGPTEAVSYVAGHDKLIFLVAVASSGIDFLLEERLEDSQSRLDIGRLPYLYDVLTVVFCRCRTLDKEAC